MFGEQQNWNQKRSELLHIQIEELKACVSEQKKVRELLKTTQLMELTDVDYKKNPVKWASVIARHNSGSIELIRKHESERADMRVRHQQERNELEERIKPD